MHRIDKVHRDLKPKNILLSDSDELQLCDIGGSVDLKEGVNRENTRNQFTTIYAPPEFDNLGFASHNSDIWSLGLIMFEIFNGRKLWNDENIRRKALNDCAVSKKDPDIEEFKGEDSQTINKIIRKCVRIESNDRMSIEGIRGLFTNVLGK